jgi:hypothetical protein
MKRFFSTLLAVLFWTGAGKAHDINEQKVIDLTYSFDEHTIYCVSCKDCWGVLVCSQQHVLC